ncbi:MAG TPA: zinc ABC transporter substrate-binding protein, partial [Ignavibacteria bacterium]|nr:zinc ABC transporter substrate-binding protein [Ignavibacteria bacterium]
MKLNFKRILSILTIVTLAVVSSGCGGKENKTNSGKVRTVSSITIINDIVKNIGGDKIEAVSICGVGLDPHTYKPKPNDPRLISES